MAGHAVDISKESRHLGDLAGRLFVPAAGVGVIALAVVLGVGLFGGDPARFYQSWLINFMFFLAITLGGLFFTILHHVTRAGWSVTVRRFAEGVAANHWILALLFIPVLMGMFDHTLFHWADQSPEALAKDSFLKWKQPYLNPTFFTIRAVVYFIIWIGLSQFFFRMSVKQDSTGDVGLSKMMQKVSAPAIILFGLSLTFAAIDWLKSLDHHFFSTIWGVYYFAGCAASFFGIAIIALIMLKGTGRLQRSVTVEHLHDLGKLLFAFGMVFWAYIAFSQYMLIWYANIPEETLWFQPRASGVTSPVPYHGKEIIPGAWNLYSIILLIGHFAAPFVLLISRVPKRRMPLLAAGALWMVIMCWFDLFWLVMPVFYPDKPGTAFAGIWLDLLTFIGMGGILLALTINRLRHHSLIPEKDPRLHESLAFENV